MKVVSACFDHTNGCLPTKNQLVLAQMRGGEFMRSMPREVLRFVKALMERTNNANHISKALRLHPLMPRNIPIDSIFAKNMMHKVNRMDSNQLFGDGAENGAESTVIDQAALIEECTKGFFNEDMTETAKVKRLEQLFRQYKKDDSQFQYALTYTESDKLSGWMFMTSRQLALAKKYGRVLFLKKVKLSSLISNWAYLCFSVLDQDNVTQIISHACFMDDSQSAYNFKCDRVVTWVPELRSLTEVTFSDESVSEETLRISFACLKIPALSTVSPSALGLKSSILKETHTKDFGKVIETFTQSLQAADTEEEYLQNYKTFVQMYPGKIADFVQNKLHPIRHRFVHAYTKVYFSAGKVDNSTAAVSAILKAGSLDKCNEYGLAWEMLINEEKQENSDRKRLIQSTTDLHQIHLKNDDPVSLCKRDFGDFAGAQFAQQLAEASSFDVVSDKGVRITLEECLQHDQPIFVLQKGGSMEDALLMQIAPSGLVQCPCAMLIQSGWPCSHILTILGWLGLPLYSPLYFNEHWKRRTDVEKIVCPQNKTKELEGIGEEVQKQVRNKRRQSELSTTILEQETERYERLMKVASSFAQECSKSEQSTQMMMNIMETYIPQTFPKKGLFLL